jgi:acetyl esterase
MAPNPFLRRLLRRLVRLPEVVARPLYGPPPVNDRGVPLDRQTHAFLRVLERRNAPTTDELGPEGARQQYEEASLVLDVARRALYRVEDRWIDGPRGTLRLRIYTPRAGNDVPACLYFHGGGYVIGSLDTHDGVCRLLAQRAGVTLIAVDYRLAPEHPFPAGVEDAFAAYRWVLENADRIGVDASRIAVAGDSAGGNLATNVGRLARDAGVPLPAFQLLVYPGTDLNRTAPSHGTFAEGFLLTRSMLDFFVANYLTDAAEKNDPRASPLLAEDLSGLPPACVAVAGFDPLRDEGEQYADALIEAGVDVEVRSYDDLIHGFWTMGGLLDRALEAIEELADVLRRGVSGEA